MSKKTFLLSYIKYHKKIFLTPVENKKAIAKER